MTRSALGIAAAEGGPAGRKAAATVVAQLSRVPGIRVTGSWATGKQTPDSDLDLCVGSKRAMGKCIQIFETAGIDWTSILIGQISTIQHVPLVNQIEVMNRCWLTPTKSPKKSVTVLGSTFRTW